MAVYAINGQDRTHNNAFQILGQGIVVGAGAGYAGKYIIPLTHEEKNSDEYIKVTNKIREQKTEYTTRTEKYLNGMRAKKNRTNAEDEFIKLFDGMQEGEHVKPGKIRKAIQTLEAKNPLEALDFKNICKETSKIANETAKQCEEAYKLVTKHIRPTSFFIITGAVVGAAVSILNDAMKTKIKD